jgi:hypothetical protein
MDSSNLPGLWRLSFILDFHNATITLFTKRGPHIIVIIIYMDDVVITDDDEKEIKELKG